MKIQVSIRHSERGNVLLAAIIMGAVIGTMMAAYLDMVNQQNQSIARSQAWNGAMPLAEAGVEEALTQLYYCSTTNLTSNGWSQAGSVYRKTRAGILGGAYVATISNDSPPTVYSTGYYTNYPSGGAVTRTVKITTSGGYLFAKGLVAKGSIAVGQGNIDSYDSHGTATYVRGTSVLGSSGDTTSLGGSISIGSNGEINGHVAVEAGGSITSSGTIGPVGSSGNNAAYMSYAATGSIPDVTVPSALLSANVLNLSGGKLFTTSGSYQCTGLGGSIVVPAGVSIVLYCNGSASFSGQSGITIANGGSLTIYLTGNFKATGNAFANSGASKNFQLYGTSTCTSIEVGGNGTFCGTIYAPEAALTADGGGNSGAIAGAAVVNTATFNGNGANFNYDVDLGREGPQSAYAVGSWSEL